MKRHSTSSRACEVVTAAALTVGLPSTVYAATQQWMDYFQPTPIIGSLSSTCWGAAQVGPRDQSNGLEDKPMKSYNYWDGGIIKDEQTGIYHMFASRWSQSFGHNGWMSDSHCVHATSTNLYGSYTDKGLCFTDNGGMCHNVNPLKLRADDTSGKKFAITCSGSVAGSGRVYGADSLDGPWTYLGDLKLDLNGHTGGFSSGDNFRTILRPDGKYECINGLVGIADNVLGTYKAQMSGKFTDTVPGHIDASCKNNMEDPFIFYAGSQYHVMYNCWSASKAFFYSSTDGINWKAEDGYAYDPTSNMVRYTDGTINHWKLLERPSVYIEGGHAVAMTFAAINVPKDQDTANSGNGSKVIVVPVDGVSYDSGGPPGSVVPSGGAGGGPSTGSGGSGNGGSGGITSSSSRTGGTVGTGGATSITTGGNAGSAGRGEGGSSAASSAMGGAYGTGGRSGTGDTAGEARSSGGSSAHSVGGSGTAAGGAVAFFGGSAGHGGAAGSPSTATNGESSGGSCAIAGRSRSCPGRLLILLGPLAALFARRRRSWCSMKCRNPRSQLALLAVTCVIASAMSACSGSGTGGISGSQSQAGASGSGGQIGNGGANTNGGLAGGGGGKNGSGGATANSGGVGAPQSGGGGTSSGGAGGNAGAANVGGGGPSSGGGGPSSGGAGTGHAGGASGSGGGAGTGYAGGAGGSSGAQQGGLSAAGGRGGSGGGGGVDAGGFSTPFTPAPVGGASKVTDSGASGGSSVGLAGNGQGAEATGLPAASRLAIHYATVSAAGTISVSVNGGTARKVNVHSTGALTGSFLYSIIDIDTPANAKVTISKASDDVAVNIDKIIVGVGDLGLPPDMWNLSPFKAADGPYKADWTALGLAYQTPQWWRDAKLGGWAHWDPQSMPEHGDWYAYDMYVPGKDSYNFHQTTFGDPSVYGYKDICKNWVIDLWDPAALMDVYVSMGVKFFMSMGAHHDNFDNWDSTYQPWNAVKIGVKQDIVGTWAKAARDKGLRFGIGLHNSPSRTWGQWEPVRYASGSKGPYDAMQTVLDGKGKWWEGLDPAALYGYQHKTDCSNDSCNTSPYGTQFMYRINDAIEKYHPDLVYFDELAGNGVVDLGVNMGLGSIATTILANYYNKSLTWNQGKMDVVMNMKGVGGQYNSFKSSAALQSSAERALVRSTEANTESTIGAYPFQTEYNIQGVYWHIMAGAAYTGAASLVTTLMQNVSRNGSLLLNLTQRGRGNFDNSLVQIAEDIGSWLKVNGEAVYASRPFEVWGDSSVIYTRNNGNVYATLLNWNGGAVTLSALKSGGATLGTVSKVEMVGSTVAMTFSQNGTGLTVTPSGSVPALSGIADSQLASKIRVLRITHDKGWFNDDDSGAVYTGWLRKANLGTGDYNNDLTTSTTTGDTWTAPFTGTGVSVYAPKESGAGKIEIQVDGQVKDTVDLSASGARQPQQLVSTVTGLSTGQHTISIINRGPGPVAVDAIVVK